MWGTHDCGVILQHVATSSCMYTIARTVICLIVILNTFSNAEKVQKYFTRIFKSEIFFGQIFTTKHVYTVHQCYIVFEQHVPILQINGSMSIRWCLSQLMV